MNNWRKWDTTSVRDHLNLSLPSSLISPVISCPHSSSHIGVRLIDEFLAKSNLTSCSNFRDTGDVISKIAFKMFLGISPEVTNWNKENSAFSLLLVDNPFIDFVELPPDYQELSYCGMLCGIIRGALEMVQLQVDCKIIRDILKGDEVTELRVELKGMMKNTMADEYKEK